MYKRQGEDGNPEIIPEQAKVVRSIYKQYLAGASFRMIQERLEIEQIPKMCIRDSLESGDSTLHLHQKVTNLGGVRQTFMWGHHPAFGYPFLDDSVRLHVAGTPTVTVPAATIAHHCPFDHETIGQWPTLPGKDGREIDMSRAYRPEDRLYMEYALSNLAEGAYELINHNSGLGVRPVSYTHLDVYKRQIEKFVRF